MKKCNGFSLMEVVSCLAIVSVIGGLSLPELARMRDSMRVSSTVYEMMGDFNKARSIAIAQNERVVISYSEKGYTIFVDSGMSGIGRHDWKRQDGELLVTEKAVPEGVKIDMVDSTFVKALAMFRPNGLGGKAGTLVVRGKREAAMKLVVSLPGRVRVEKI